MNEFEQKLSRQSPRPIPAAWRAEILRAAQSAEPTSHNEFGLIGLIWRELIFPSRRIWAGLATVWILILLVNFSQRDHSQMATAKAAAPEMMSFGEQQRLLNELLADRSLPPDADRPKTFLPKPRTETVRFLTA